MKNVLDLFFNKKIQEINDEIANKNNILLTNSGESHNLLLASYIYNKKKDYVIYVTSNNYKASKCYDSLVKINGYESVNLYLMGEVVASEVDAVSKEFVFERLQTLSNIIKEEKKIIVTTIQAISKELIPFKGIKDSVVIIKKNTIVNRNELISSLIKLGYRKVPTTSAVGDFSVRGEVIDIFPLNETKPIRIDFFDDEIERIIYFDKDNQRTIKGDTLFELSIYPNTELIYNKKEVLKKLDKCDDYNINQDFLDIENYTYTERLFKYVKYMYDTTESILDYIRDKIVIFENSDILYQSYSKTIEELYYFTETKDIYNKYNFAFYYDFYRAFDNVTYINSFPFSKLENNGGISYDKKIDLEAYSVINYNNNVKLLLDEIKHNNSKYILAFSKEENMNIMIETLNANKIDYKINSLDSKVSVIQCDNAISFAFYNGICLIDESNIYKKMSYKNTRYRSVYQSSSLINSKEDLKPGDYIVHYDYGIGRYIGVVTKTTGDIISDYISIEFANITLSIPVENINLLEKYHAEEGIVPKLTTVGNGEWDKKKKKIKEKIESIARDLLVLQAFRETKKGFKYEVDNEIQEEFEAEFQYEETKDQLEAINDIKRDMEEGKIVDRLVCGDVGFGKTEVAIRIALKTVLNGKQVAYLAPTTILSRQHYFSFKERMEAYGLNIALMNRLISSKEKKRVISDLKSGNIDIVIGTHALLNDEVSYKDLGLLIVDEEQRFGVVHKEKIKQYKNNINVLTLTATPIPRTLQMSIVGARQMSLIETAPLNRYPVQTYVLEKNDSIVREAIYNELGRKGQVFYLHNKVLDIENIYNKLKRLVPEARIIIAHGKMSKIELENAVQSFIDYEYDILLCTTIIETGIDIPNTNTLIVDMADRLGLAQMYQIRGRVGRSDRVSYAYFMYERANVLTQEGNQRLNAIKEFTNLGSGYKIAVRDLAIRGAGDFLGKEQSGYIDAIGMDMYIKLLNESISEIKGIKEEKPVENNNFIEISKHIDDNYVSDDDIKIYIHKIINSINTKEDKDYVINELNDRFGKINDEILLYINKQYLDSLLKKYDIIELNTNDFKVKMVFSKESSEKIGGQKMMETIYSFGEDFSVEYRNKRFYVYILKIIDRLNWINKAIEFLEKL